MGKLQFFIFKIFGEGNFSMPCIPPTPSSFPLLMFRGIWLQDLTTLRERKH